MGLAIFIGILVLLIILVIARTVRIVQQGYVGVIKRLGQFLGSRPPGVVFLVPLIDDLQLVDIRETPRTGDKQDVITRDNVTVSVNATIFSHVVDAKLALFSVSNYFIAIDQLSRTTLRASFGGMTLDEALSQRERINAQLQQQMESVTDKWGIRINRIEIVDIAPPQQILNALALQKTADQEKRALILKSEGQQQSAVNIADGAKQAAIKNAEGERQAAILRAEGIRQATILEAEGRGQAIATVYKAIHDAAGTNSHLGPGCGRSGRRLLRALGHASTDALPRVLVASCGSARPASQSASFVRRPRAPGVVSCARSVRHHSGALLRVLVASYRSSRRTSQAASSDRRIRA